MNAAILASEPSICIIDDVSLTHDLGLDHLMMRVINAQDHRAALMKYDEPCERLRYMRKEIGKFQTASDAAKNLNVPTPTYISHENGTRKISPDQAKYYSEKFNIPPTWLLYGPGAESVNTNAIYDSLNHASSPPVPPSSPICATEPDAFLSLFQARLGPSGRIVPIADTADSVELEDIDATSGFVAQLVGIDRPDRKRHRVVSLPGIETDATLAIDEVLRVPRTMISYGTIFAVSLRQNDLFAGASDLDYAFVVAGASVEAENFYCVSIGCDVVVVYFETCEGKTVTYRDALDAEPKRGEIGKDLFVLGRVTGLCVSMGKNRLNFSREWLKRADDRQRK